jgi:hypothetical protein
MAHFAELDENNHVTRTLVVGNEDCLDGNGEESEAVGAAYLEALLPGSGPWKQTSYNNNTRHIFAGPGFVYEEERDIFYALTPPDGYPSWVFSDDTLHWEPPIPRPGGAWRWVEETISWYRPEDPPWEGSVWDDDTGWSRPEGWVDPPLPDYDSYPGVEGEAPFYYWNQDTTSWIEVE